MTLQSNVFGSESAPEGSRCISVEEFKRRVRAMGMHDEFTSIVQRFGLAGVGTLISLSRQPHVQDARCVAMRLVRARLDWSFPAIGDLFGCHHTTARSAINQNKSKNPRKQRGWMPEADVKDVKDGEVVLERKPRSAIEMLRGTITFGPDPESDIELVSFPAAKERPSFDSVYLGFAHLIARRSSCSRLSVGCCIVSTDYRRVLSVGYNGGASGLENDCDRNEKGEVTPGFCGHLHAEVNAIINCCEPRTTKKYVYLTDLPCVQCAKALINLGGVERVVYARPYRITDSLDWFKRAGIVAQHVPYEG